MALDEFLKTYRTKRGLTQEELAAVSGLTRSWISAVEQGNVRELSSSKALKLAKGLRIKIDEIYAAQGLTKSIKPARPRGLIDAIRELQTFEENTIEVPIVIDPRNPSDITGYTYMDRRKPGINNFIAVVLKDLAFENIILNGDKIIIDLDLQPQLNNIIYYYDSVTGQPKLARYNPATNYQAELFVVVSINRNLL